MEYQLKRWKEKYTRLIVKYAGDFTLADTMPDDFPRPFTGESALRFMEQRQLADDSQEYARAIIIDGEVAGSLLIRRLTGSRSCAASLEFWLGEPFRGCGVMSAALREACPAAFDRLGVVRIQAEVPSPNSAARGALNNAGFDLEGRLEKGVISGGEPVDLCVYARIYEPPEASPEVLFSDD